MAAGNTYVALATQTLSSGANSVTFNSIPSGYTDLRIVVNASVTAGAYDYYLRFNGDSTSGLYSDTILDGNGSAAASTRHSSQNMIRLSYNSYMTTSLGMTLIDVMQYLNTNVYKTVLARTNNTAIGLDGVSGLWRNTAAITSITISAESAGTMAVGSTFTIYGILAA